VAGRNIKIPVLLIILPLGLHQLSPVMQREKAVMRLQMKWKWPKGDVNEMVSCPLFIYA